MNTYRLVNKYINLDNVKVMEEPEIKRNYEINGKGGFCYASINIDKEVYSWQNWNEYNGKYYLDEELGEEDKFEQFCQEAVAIWHSFTGED